mmetsp:Transcript_29698/g.64847  ORF Transcript_29698/g.64847 Transcript_29698/m.64847 type:complete len:131 (-) Transcript_29698:214-606(-)|eukprot:CAMPEP_0118933986 /NCGR_PEP_ID=MMETSP1169-20130426/13210_1 /TAXON_ID=36882 /ORGANISM="Pyramimonas obovata, Strain CCMP722" /LENGTH=130 /DNA_ID=CAMNT_0006876837 /DNA_START=228 /DNA_END=620 /DNA_ORIENTATION=+
MAATDFVIDYSAGSRTEVCNGCFDCAPWGEKKTATRITLKPGFDWRKSVGQRLPGCPSWCPAMHYGYLESGKIKVTYEDGTAVEVNTDAVYKIPSGHLIEVVGEEDAVMVEFSQSTANIVASIPALEVEM